MTIPPQILDAAFGSDAQDARVSLVADRRGTALWHVRHENADQHALNITTDEIASRKET
ncbi:hypothetical protein [Streptomyces niveus]